MAQLFRNNAFSNLGASLTNSDTTLTVTTGHGDRFPVVAAPDFCLLTLQDASNNIEIVRVTARTSGSDSMTIQRAQEGTSARAWNIGDVVELRLTASALGPLSLLEGASTAATVRAAIDAAASSHTHTASQISDSTAVGRAVLTAADQAAARSAIGAPATDGTGATGTWGVSVTGNAATATKLQTARTINGTSFDGSGDITTANWGTARTLTIGNTGKSFDGSANVSWSVNEIGAARFGILANGTDLNTVVEPGFYRLGSPQGNAPPSVDYGQLIVARGGADTILQIVTGYSDGEIYWRQGNPPSIGGVGPWSAWHRFFHSGNLGVTGMVAYFASSTPPPGWLAANGAAVSRTTYAALFNAIGTTFGTGDGSTTFNLPDLRGEFIRGWDNGRGVDIGRALGAFQDATGIDDQVYQTVTLYLDNGENPYASGTYNSSSGYDGVIRAFTRWKVRPRNVAMLACIKF